MGRRFAELAFTPLVREEQTVHGSRHLYERVERSPDPGDRLGPDEQAFIRERDGFYMASVTETGWPYIQFRGGKIGFIHIPDDRTIAFADLRGNRQYISTANLKHDDRVALFFMDYPTQSRLKVLGRANSRRRCGGTEVDRIAARARREISTRARIHHSRRSLRLELPAAHYPALLRRGTRNDPRTHASPSRGSGSRK